MTSHPEFTFYYHTEACSIAVRILLNNLALPFKAIPMRQSPNGIEPADDSLTALEYKAQVHHMGYVPALTFTDPTTGKKEVLIEMPAILNYLVSVSSLDTEAKEKLTGSTPLEKARVTSWLAWLSATVHAQAFGPFFAPHRFYDADTVITAGGNVEDTQKAVVEGAKKKAVFCYESIERRIADSEYGTVLGGKEVTLVDINAYVFLRWGRKAFDMSKFVKYAKMGKKVEELEGAKKALQQEGLEALAV
ncbi:hypothetical protein QBC35DRAFT_509029 [Podospora australis]|uniref:Glutathione S-transferase n=1 Tax=Podospora australis TaxID=1536484 RepID=A0AAN6WJA2_9PEZI|nr:hypothetical protein QBC35DRAFT_509029 [Podospora australis]